MNGICRKCQHEKSIHDPDPNRKVCLAMTPFGPCLCDGFEEEVEF